MPKKKVSEEKTAKQSICCGKHSMSCGGGGAVYGLGFIGALVYYISNATGFWNGALVVLKAIVWPAFLVYKLMVFLGV
ncbi:hypothetical protein J4212_07235 [Candidatus Woesearchaeota archaeon]|nr:hypothetical protein [Candidatus Woesearchaeota archaeon]